MQMSRSSCQKAEKVLNMLIFAHERMHVQQVHPGPASTSTGRLYVEQQTAKGYCC
jgi:hypothetical protein